MPTWQIHGRAFAALSVVAWSTLTFLLLMLPAGHFDWAYAADPPDSAQNAGSLPKVTADRTAIIKKLLAYQFDTLNSELSADEEKAEGDPRFEMNAMVAFAAFDTPLPLIAERVKDWQKAQPDSYAAALARAVSLSAAAENVPDSNMDQMDQYYSAALKAENAALSINPNLGIAYALKIKAARMDAGDLARISGEALKRVPASFAVREQIMYALRPRWGGSREAMQKFSDASQRYAAENPAMKFLKAWIPLDQGDDYADDNQWDHAIEEYTEALRVGGEYWTTYRRRAKAYFTIGDYPETIHDALHANQLFPQNSEVLRLLAMSTAQDDRPEACILWSATYLRFDLPDPAIFALVQNASKEMKAQGKVTP